MERLLSFLETSSAAETAAFGKKIGRALKPGSVLALVGPLGSGKTTFVKGLARGLGMKNSDEVTSPTFVVLHEYRARLPIFHLDLYRLEGAEDVEEVGWEDCLGRGGVVVVEWAKKIGGYLPREYLEIQFTYVDESRRRISMLPVGKRYESLKWNSGEKEKK